MKKDLFVSCYTYADWANNKILEKVALLSYEPLNQPNAGFRPVYETLLHLANADRRWLTGWQGLERPPHKTAEELPTSAAIEAFWRNIWQERRAYIDSLDEAQFDQPISPNPPPFLRWQAMLTAANHGVQHRAEIAAAVTVAGHSPGDLDYVFYIRSI